MEIEHHGGARGVTGNCHRLRVSPGQSYLVDCGLFQGRDHGPGDTVARHTIEFPVDDIQALVVTHVHIDHIGRLPYLLAAGYSGPILCSRPSARLLPLVLEDALRVGFTRDRRLIERFLAEVTPRIHGLDYQRWHRLPAGDDHTAWVRLQRAGHILGSAYVEFDIRQRGAARSERVVFSGDLGAPHAPLLPAPQPPFRADVLVLESTYGDRLHGDRRRRRDRLQAAIDHAHADGGTVIVPAFSIGRTQELLYEFEGLIHRGGCARWRDMEVVLDSPLAARFTALYREMKGYWDAEAHKRLRAGRHPLNFENLYTVDDHQEHLRTVDYLARSGRPAVVIAASGMAAGGRVVNYLKAMLGDPRHHVLFVGYQAEGTPGRMIQESGTGGAVELDGERYTIRAGVDTISGYSAHADQNDLVRFVRRIQRPPKEIRLTHGERPAREALRERLLAETSATTVI